MDRIPSEEATSKNKETRNSADADETISRNETHGFVCDTRYECLVSCLMP
jgi:hypothetical protein